MIIDDFNSIIQTILQKHFKDKSQLILESSPLLQYLQHKTRSANRGSKSRGSFANLYAIYVLVEDYLKKGFDKKSAQEYSDYQGAVFSELLARQRELPFGQKLQNHALNSRLNEEFKKYFPAVNIQPIVRNLTSSRYWIQQDLIFVSIPLNAQDREIIPIAHVIIEIINAYIDAKLRSSELFLDTCKRLAKVDSNNTTQSLQFILEQLKPEVDARIFEIISYAILKVKYGQEFIWIGKTRQTIIQQPLRLYKTGRTNANDGGIDFVMKPLGRFFQVTETIDINKYFLDIDKVQLYPITFVVKSELSVENIIHVIKQQALKKYNVSSVVEMYLQAIEEIINIEGLKVILEKLVREGKLIEIFNEIILQYKVEFNIPLIAS